MGLRKHWCNGEIFGRRDVALFHVFSPFPVIRCPCRQERKKVMPFDEKCTNRYGGMPISFCALHQDACGVGSSGVE